ncbi:MAG: hypothetical protein FJ292_02215 [Planctomycetes bacterium]|nr:hypothetical protein [Planctomycetota bacterium]
MTLEMLNKDRWSIVRAMFDAVPGLPDAQRGKFLDFACPDPGIRAEVESLLGSGGVGSVHAARNGISGARVAIKVVRSVGLGRQALIRFRQECRALARQKVELA